MKLSLAARVVRAYAVGVPTLLVFVVAGWLIGSLIANTVPSDGFESLGVFLWTIFVAAGAAVVAQIPIGRLAGLGWGYGVVLTLLVGIWTWVAVWQMGSMPWLSGGVAVAPFLAAAVTGRHGTPEEVGAQGERPTPPGTTTA